MSNAENVWVMLEISGQYWKYVSNAELSGQCWKSVGLAGNL